MKTASFLEPVDELPERVRHRGRVSQPIFKQFLASGMQMARVKVEELMPGRKPTSLMAVLKAYALNHPELGVEVAMVNGQIYLMRTREPEKQEKRPDSNQ
ncbi:hypothetical protein DRN75_03280 [Nanoarchaeota archaeon]|nr:MAG: hypothetical protein DRN75_03280 [Nanoarchaeota archaeon]